jgi:hypothetical protein
MSTVRRQSPAFSAPLRVEADGESLALQRVFEASWQVSRLALSASRPDLKLPGTGPEVVLRWHVRAHEIEGTWSLDGASAVLSSTQRGGEVTIFSIEGDAAAHEFAVVVDGAANLISLRLCRGGREVLSLSAPLDESAASPSYARTSLLAAAGPAGLAVGGGRYELDGVKVEMARGN